MSIAKVCVRIPSEKKEELLRLAEIWRKSDNSRGPGWDAKIIHRIARQHYGGLEAMFKAHDWPERGKDMMPKVQKRISQTYGSVEKFACKFLDANEAISSSAFPFGAWGKPAQVCADSDHMVEPTDDKTLDEMGL